MRCLAVCQSELVIRMLDEALVPSFEVEFLVESKPVARRLHEAGLNVFSGDPKRTDTYLKADVTPATCVIVEDTGKRGMRKTLEAIRDAAAGRGVRGPSPGALRSGGRGSVPHLRGRLARGALSA